MMYSLRKQPAVQLGTDEDKRCNLCDKADGNARFVCSHPGCCDCVATGECRICAPLMEPSSNRPLLGGSHTEGAKTSELPISPQETLETAGMYPHSEHQTEYQKHRISEKLRVEKELFPECIQAPAKYFNKRKSLNVSKKGKENRRTIFPGEGISPSEEFTMNKSRSYVQEWLNKQSNTSFGPQPRSPFSDLKVNTHHNQTHSTPVKDIQKENVSKFGTRQSNRKRPKLKQTPSKTNLENFLKPVEKADAKKAWSAKRLKKEFDDAKHLESKVEDKHQSNENMLEIGECYTIEDTPEQIVDKDKLALLEVQKASHKESVQIIKDTEVKSPHKKYQVPFLKKNYLFENCAECINDGISSSTENENYSQNSPIKASDISITVENKSFIATISVVDCSPCKKQSTAVQTVDEPFLGFEQPVLEESAALISKMVNIIEDDIAETDSQRTSCSDGFLQEKVNKSDGNIRADNMDTLGHSSEHGYGVLNALDGAGNSNKRPRRGRGATPDSNNSSDKENCDPNRKKRQAKKKKNKK